jgi:predicted ATP-grasp superfamily ATP-dependent carboligase
MTATALVVDVGWVNGLAAIRSLGRAGVKVLAVDHRRSALGFRSRYAKPLLSPDPQDEEAFVAFLAELELETPAPIFPTHDEPLNAIARAGDRLGERYLFPFSGWDVLQRIQSKRSQLEAAERAGIPVPRWATTSAAADELGYPVLVKPSSTEGFKRRFGRQAFRCENRAEVERAFAEAAEYEPLVQELIPGGDGELYTLGSYLSADGEPLGLFCGRKLRQTPPGIGTCRVGEAVWVEEVVDQGLRLLCELGHTGLSQVEVKRDARDGSYRLMEVNPRLWQWHGLAAACGVDLPRIAYEDLTGERPDPVTMNGRGRRWAITLMSGERPAPQRPPYVDAVFARDDLRPALVQAARILPRRRLRRRNQAARALPGRPSETTRRNDVR